MQQLLAQETRSNFRERDGGREQQARTDPSTDGATDRGRRAGNIRTEHGQSVTQVDVMGDNVQDARARKHRDAST